MGGISSTVIAKQSCVIMNMSHSLLVILHKIPWAALGMIIEVLNPKMRVVAVKGLHTSSQQSAKAWRHIVKDPQSMTHLFCMEEKREDDANSEVLERVERCVKHLKQRGGLKVSWEG